MTEFPKQFKETSREPSMGDLFNVITTLIPDLAVTEKMEISRNLSNYQDVNSALEYVYTYFQKRKLNTEDLKEMLKQRGIIE